MFLRLVGVNGKPLLVQIVKAGKARTRWLLLFVPTCCNQEIKELLRLLFRLLAGSSATPETARDFSALGGTRRMRLEEQAKKKEEVL
jgi:hypothetical protein